MRFISDTLTGIGIAAILIFGAAYLGHVRDKPISSDIWCSVFEEYDDKCRGEI